MHRISFAFALFLLSITRALAAPSADTCNYAGTIRKLTQQMIDTAEKYAISKSRGALYTIRFFHFDKDKKDISCSISYIMKTGDIPAVNYYFMVEDNIVLAGGDSDLVEQIKTNELKTLHFAGIDSTSRTLFTKKMYRDTTIKGILMYHPSVIVCRIRKCNIQTRFLGGVTNTAIYDLLYGDKPPREDEYPFDNRW